MSSTLTDNPSPSLQSTPQPAPVRLVANMVSYLFHPVFVPVYVMAFLLFLHPFAFTGTLWHDRIRVFMMGVLMFTFFPLVTVFLLWRLDFISSIHMPEKKDRIIPLIACGVFYFWVTYIWWNSHRMSDGLLVPVEAVRFALAVFLSSWLALMLNIIMKVSLHAAACGVMLAFMGLLALNQDLNFGVYVSIAVLITGLVCTARLIISNHSQTEIYSGLLAGIAAMLIAWWVA